MDSTERLFFSFEFAKPFGRTKFLRSKYQYGSEFSQIGKPHFSLEGVLYLCEWEILDSEIVTTVDILEVLRKE